MNPAHHCSQGGFYRAGYGSKRTPATDTAELKDLADMTVEELEAFILKGRDALADAEKPMLELTPTTPDSAPNEPID